MACRTAVLSALALALLSCSADSKTAWTDKADASTAVIRTLENARTRFCGRDSRLGAWSTIPTEIKIEVAEYYWVVPGRSMRAETTIRFGAERGKSHYDWRSERFRQAYDAEFCRTLALLHSRALGTHLTPSPKPSPHIRIWSSTTTNTRLGEATAAQGTLAGIDLARIFGSSNISGLDLSHIDLRNSQCTSDCRFSRVDFSHARLAAANFSGSHFTHSSFYKAQSLGEHSDASLNIPAYQCVQCTFDQSIISHAFLHGNQRNATFNECLMNALLLSGDLEHHTITSPLGHSAFSQSYPAQAPGLTLVMALYDARTKTRGPMRLPSGSDLPDIDNAVTRLTVMGRLAGARWSNFWIKDSPNAHLAVARLHSLDRVRFWPAL